MRAYNLEQPQEYFAGLDPEEETAREPADIFLMGFSERTLDEKSGAKVDALAAAYRKNKIPFRFMQPMPVCIFGERFDDAKARYNFPDDCAQCHFRPQLVNEKRIRLCNGAIVSPKDPVKGYPSYGKMAGKFDSIYRETGSLPAVCSGCKHLLSGKCKSLCIRGIFSPTDRFSLNPKLHVKEMRDDECLCADADSASFTFVKRDYLAQLKADLGAGKEQKDLPQDRYPEMTLLSLHAKGFLAVNGRDYNQGIFAEKPNGLYVVIELSKMCNLRCRYCSVSADKGPVIGDDILRKIAQDLAAIRSNNINVQFIGGEPLLHQDKIERFIAYLGEIEPDYRNRFLFIIQTNGTLIDDKAIALIKRHKILTGVSLDGPEEIHDQNRVWPDGSSSFGKVMDGLARLRAAGIDFRITTVLCETSYEQISKICEFFIENNIKDVRLNLHNEIGRSGKRDFSPEEYEELAESMVRAYKTYGDRINLVNIGYFLINVFTKERLNNCMRSPCGAGKTNVMIDYDGVIYPCDSLHYIDRLRLGNVRDITIAQAMRSAPCLELAGRVVENIDGCRECNLRQVCSGGCTMNSLRTFGDLRSRGMECRYNLRLFDELLPVIKGRLSLYDW